MGITVVSYTLKDIRDEEVSLFVIVIYRVGVKIQQTIIKLIKLKTLIITTVYI